MVYSVNMTMVNRLETANVKRVRFTPHPAECGNSHIDKS